MYFNAYDSNGGDVADNGLAQNYTQNNSTTETPFVTTTTSGPVYYGWTNEGNVYGCGIPLGIMYGTLAAGGAYGEGYSFLGVGEAAYDPSQMELPPSSTTWINPSWTFYYTPPSLGTGAVGWNGYTSNCQLCSVARMLTIGQSQPGNDGSCFGDCNGVPTARWDQVVAGNLISPCDNSVTPFICTIAYEPDWQGGVATSNNGEVTAEYSQESGLEGINTAGQGYQISTADVGKFASPLPQAPSTACTTDADSYCAVETSSGNTSSCLVGTVAGKPLYAWDSESTFEIFKKIRVLELQETATEISTRCPVGTIKTAWSPGNPATQYNDSALP